MIERVVENWLTNASERGGFEAPFCQALTASGLTILFRSTHGQEERGKDIIALDSRGVFRTYQLKTGDLTLPALRDLYGELAELVCLPPVHPSVPDGATYRPCLVTNGLLKDPARQTLVEWQRQWQRQGHPRLETMDRDQLLPFFLRSHEHILPVQPADFERFLRLLLISDKSDLLNKGELCRFLTTLLPLDRRPPAPRVQRRTCAAVAVLAGYILSGFSNLKNHLAVAEGWLLTAFHILLMAEKWRSPRDTWEPSFSLCLEAWHEALERLVTEALDRQHWVEGNVLADGIVYRWRVTTLLGHLCAAALYLRAQGKTHPREDEILMAVDRRIRKKEAWFWGEHAGPFLLAIIWLLWLRGQEGFACQIALELITAIAKENGAREGLGIPDPFYDCEAVLMGRVLSEAFPEKEVFGRGQTFRGRSYLVRPLVEFLVRRDRRRTLQREWRDITRVDWAESRPDRPEDVYLWRFDNGTETVRHWPEPQRWQELLREATTADSHILLTQQYVPLILPFLLTYPHRLNPDFVSLFERAIDPP